MVSVPVIEAPESVPAPEEPTPDHEETPDLEVEGVPAAEAPPEAAPDEGEPEEPEPIVPVEEERKYTQAELREIAAQVQRDTLEAERRQRQAEGARRANEARREAEERQELKDVVEVAIARGDDAEAINNLLARYTDKREGQHFTRATSDMETAVQYLVQPLLGGDQVNLDDRSTQIALRLQDRFHAVYAKGLEDGKAGLQGETIPKADLKKYVDAEISRINKAKNQDKRPLGRVDGDASIPRDDSDEARVNRIISNTADERDKDWWNTRFKKDR